MTGERSQNVVWHAGSLRRAGGATVWMTGLPGAGKSTLACAVEADLARQRIPCYCLDGDNLRHGLNGDLGFSAADRHENVRRTAEVARLLADAGLVAVCALVSPYRAGREHARQIHDSSGLPFLEVHISTSLAECERRDPKGLYARARAGAISGMTGVDDPYEAPTDPEIEIDCGAESVAVGVEMVLAALCRIRLSTVGGNALPDVRPLLAG